MSLTTLSPETEALVEKLLAQLSLQEKIALLSGLNTWSTVPITRKLDGAPQGIPALIMTDGPHGVRTNQPDASRPVSDTTTAFPTGVAMASTWNPDLIRAAGVVLGKETLATGCDILLGPCVNIVRTPIAGRNFEAFSEDPILAGKIAAAYIAGVQSTGAGTSLKHFAANNQEIERYRGDSIVDERTLREIYLRQFEIAVKEAQPWTVMCSYNRLNGTYASQHHRLLTEVLRDEWGFEGLVVSDWTANHTTTESVKGGLDLEMPGPAKWYGKLLFEAASIWQIELADIDTAARRVLRIIARSGKLTGTAAKRGKYNLAEHQAVARQVAEEAIVLLKNKNGILPLQPRQLQSLAIIGPAAQNISISGGGSSHTEPPYRSTPIQKIQANLGEQTEVRFEPGCDNWVDTPLLKAGWVTPTGSKTTAKAGLYGEYFRGSSLEGAPTLTRIDPRLDYFWFSAGPHESLGNHFSARWSGSLNVPDSGRYTLRVNHSGSARLLVDGKLLFESQAPGLNIEDLAQKTAQVKLTKGKAHSLQLELINQPGQAVNHIRLSIGAAPDKDDRLERAVELAREAEVALVFVGDNEQWETEGNDRPHLRLPGRQDELISAVAAANPNTIVVLNTGAPVEMPWIDQVAGLIQMHYPGLEGGSAITKVLSGEINPSGKLTASYPLRLEDTPSFHNLSVPGARTVRYGEGIFVGYRHYDRVEAPVLFPFGHGLSYTTFRYARLRAPAACKPGKNVSVSLDVTNTGSLPGKEIVQLYVSDVLCSLPRPVKELKGFAKVDLQPGETKTVKFTLTSRDFAFYDEIRQDWVAEPGEFELIAAASAADLRLRRTITLEE